VTSADFQASDCSAYNVCTTTVERTDLIGTVPKRVGVHAAENLAIEIYEVPLPLPQPEFALYWHERSRDDLGHRWLRDRIAALMRVQSD
jgi:DNA-binding transcriptional LysR family regulator